MVSTTKQTTIRIPARLASNVAKLAKVIGFTKVDIIKMAILEQLFVSDLTKFHPTTVGSGNFVRTAISLNDNMKEYLQRLAEAQKVSVNSLIVFATNKTYEHYSKLLKEQGLK